MLWKESRPYLTNWKKYANYVGSNNLTDTAAHPDGKTKQVRKSSLWHCNIVCTIIKRAWEIWIQKHRGGLLQVRPLQNTAREPHPAHCALLSCPQTSLKNAKKTNSASSCKNFTKIEIIHYCFLKWQPFRLTNVSGMLQAHHCDWYVQSVSTSSSSRVYKVTQVYDLFKVNTIYLLYLCACLVATFKQPLWGNNSFVVSTS
jgi:hypothetical protein